MSALGYGAQEYGAWEYGTRRPVLPIGDPISIVTTAEGRLHKVHDLAGGTSIAASAHVDLLRLMVALGADEAVSVSAEGDLQRLAALLGSLHIEVSHDALLETLNRFGGGLTILTGLTGDMQRVAVLEGGAHVAAAPHADLQRVAPMGAAANIDVTLWDAFRLDLFFKAPPVHIVTGTVGRLLTVLPLTGRVPVQLGAGGYLQRLPKLGGATAIEATGTGRLTGDFWFTGAPVRIDVVCTAALRKEWEPVKYPAGVWAPVVLLSGPWTPVDYGHDQWEPFDHFGPS